MGCHSKRLLGWWTKMLSLCEKQPSPSPSSLLLSYSLSLSLSLSYSLSLSLSHYTVCTTLYCSFIIFNSTHGSPSGWDNEKKISILYEHMKQFKPGQDYSSVVMTPKTIEVGGCGLGSTLYAHMYVSTYAHIVYALACRAVYVLCFVLCSNEFWWWITSVLFGVLLLFVFDHRGYYQKQFHLETLPAWVLPLLAIIIIMIPVPSACWGKYSTCTTLQWYSYQLR